MASEKIIKNTGPKYSEMLVQLVKEFDDRLPGKANFEEKLEIAVEAWNLANKKAFLKSRGLYEKELKAHDNPEVVEKMVDHKLKEFPNHDNVIIGFNLNDNVLQVKTQTQENHFDDIMKRMVNYNPNKD